MTNLTLPIAFIAGILSFFSPCILPLVPSYIFAISGLSFQEYSKDQDSARVRRVLIFNSIFFILGFSLVFIVLGATASLLGQVLIAYKDLIRIVGGALVIIMGIFLMDIFNFGFLSFEHRLQLPKKAGYLGAFFVGVTFAAAWTPCIGPILGAILVLASSSNTIGSGILLLVVYSLGLAVPFLLTAVLLRSALRYFQQINQYAGKIKLISGILLIIVGVLLITNWIQYLIILP